jgi:dTDP-4-amino-4,6-dideoxygalactose transaminase
MALAGKHGLIVIEDAAQAIGAEYKGRRAGSIGHYGCFSFFPSKNLGAAGDGGMIVTEDPERAEKLRCLRAHGSKPKYYHKIVGGNFRLDALQAAIVSAKLPHLDSWTAGRQKNAQVYDKLFADAGIADNSHGIPAVALPRVLTTRHIFNQYVIRVSRRDQLQAALKQRGIGSEVYYPVPMHIQECFAYLGHHSGDFPESERAAQETLAIPIYPELSEVQLRYVVDCIRDFVLKSAPTGPDSKQAALESSKA